MQSAVSVGTIGVFRVEPVALNHKLCHIAAGKIPMRQAVGTNLPQDAVSGADALEAFLHKGIANEEKDNRKYCCNSDCAGTEPRSLQSDNS